MSNNQFFSTEKLRNISRPFVAVDKVQEITFHDPYYGDSITVLRDQDGNTCVVAVDIKQ
jgi:hypothetical protein